MAQRTEFGKKLLSRLIEMDKTTIWLAEQVNEKTGMFCDQSYISNIVNGKRNAPKIVEAIKQICGMEES